MPIGGKILEFLPHLTFKYFLLACMTIWILTENRTTVTILHPIIVQVAETHKSMHFECRPYL